MLVKHNIFVLLLDQVFAKKTVWKPLKCIPKHRKYININKYNIIYIYLQVLYSLFLKHIITLNILGSRWWFLDKTKIDS